MGDERKVDPVERELISRLRAGRDGASAVYADWLEERGMRERAEMIRRRVSALGALAGLARWLNDVGLLGMTSFEVAPGACAVGMGSDVPIPPRTGVTMVVRPQRSPFRPIQLAIPDEIAEHFLVTDVRVGNRSQLRSATPLPASAFAASVVERSAGDRRIDFEVVQTAQDLMLEVENVGARPLTFFALVFGREPTELPGQIAAVRGEVTASQMADIIARVRAAADDARTAGSALAESLADPRRDG